MAHDPILLATAIEAVLKAGEIQLSRFGTVLRIDKKGGIDLVTEVDLEIERGFRRMIADRFPGHSVLGEEFAGSAELEASPPPYRWVFDPIDGTTNFAHGLPIFCASLALEIEGRVEVAAVYDPTRRELFTAERGGGAYLNGERLAVSAVATLIDALLVTGFPYNVHETVDEIVSLFGAFVGRARAVRRLGSAALDLCYVGAGRMDAFWEHRLSPWDVAGGSLIVEEAGGLVTGMDASPFRSTAGHVLASNGALHGEMLSVIRGHAAERSEKRTF
jgi:myo-inositol-1(or 4)-monophosphatase